MEKREIKGVKVYLVEDVSKKNDKPYTAVRVEFDEDPDLDKMVFINNRSEIKALKNLS